MKILDGQELASFIKERQAHQVAGLAQPPKLLIIRDSDNPVIVKYVNLKIAYGQDIGVDVEDYFAQNSTDIAQKIQSANQDPTVSGIILQLPILEKSQTDALTNLIAPHKDVDGLSSHSDFDSATATAINWLLAGHNITLDHQKIAILGQGKLVGAPLYQMFLHSGYQVDAFAAGDDLTKLNQYDIIITATGVPGLVSDAMVKPGAILVDAGTASEHGILKGDLSNEVRSRQDLTAITPPIGGVGPLTITCLFDHVIQATTRQASNLTSAT
ncbi:bifunctional 5,10-methylenetetrahydrofolate dehydrogenase/5,10-methenyltetrahydrofolate cyclohydrolase [Candidatus Saccharibacteria bacterium]|nr:bifunctional 5,10-methylenetetrahydrofolate dehydrogenase/5,10-methenyltetrahydrofolate cyclohydrolase [Candidatus Saccharibacteria bacterium]